MAVDPQEAAKSHGKMMTAIAEGSDAYPKPAGVTFAYGTAGFRMKWVHIYPGLLWHLTISVWSFEQWG